MNASSQSPAPQYPARSVAALVAGAVAIGFAPVFVRLSEMGPSTTAFWRVTLALPAMLVWAGRSRPATEGKKSALWPVIVAGVSFAGDLAVWHLSIAYTSVANATLEANLASVFVVLFGWLALGQRPRRQFLLAMGLALAGTVLLIGRNAQITAGSLRGDGLGVTSALFYAGYLLSVKEARDRGWPAGRVMATSGVITMLVLLPLAWWTEGRLWPATLHGWMVLAGLAAFSHVGGQGLITWALAGLPAAWASLALLVQPATAALAAWALLGETLAAGQLLGAVMLLTGLWLARRS